MLWVSVMPERHSRSARDAWYPSRACGPPDHMGPLNQQTDRTADQVARELPDQLVSSIGPIKIGPPDRLGSGHDRASRSHESPWPITREPLARQNRYVNHVKRVNSSRPSC